jgi:hypothetical protein
MEPPLPLPENFVHEDIFAIVISISIGANGAWRVFLIRVALRVGVLNFLVSSISDKWHERNSLESLRELGDP